MLPIFDQFTGLINLRCFLFLFTQCLPASDYFILSISTSTVIPIVICAAHLFSYERVGNNRGKRQLILPVRVSSIPIPRLPHSMHSLLKQKYNKIGTPSFMCFFFRWNVPYSCYVIIALVRFICVTLLASTAFVVWSVPIYSKWMGVVRSVGRICFRLF